MSEEQLLQRTQRQHAALVRLATHPGLASGNLEAAFPAIAEVAAETLAVERVNIWRYSPDGAKLRCLEAFQRSLGEHSAGHILEARAYPRYFAALAAGRVVDAIHVTTDPRTSELTADYWEPLGISSSLDAPIRLHGEVVGVVCLENTGPPRTWHHDEIAFAGQVADLVAQAFLHADLRRRADELAALHKTFLDITTPHDLPTVLRTIVERATGLLNAPSGGLYLFDLERQEARCVVSYNTPIDYTGIVLKYGEGAAGTVAQTGEPLIIDDYRTWPGRAGVFEEEQPFTAVLCIPMIWQSQVTGMIDVLDDAETRRFTQDDLELLTLFANQAAIAVENARLYEAAQRRAQEAETLRHAGAVVAATLQQDEAIERILEQLGRVVPHDSASVQLLRDGGYLEIVGGRGWQDPTAVSGIRFPIPGDNPNTVVIQERRPHILDDAPASYPTFREDPHSHIRSWLGVPLIVRDRVVGMLAVDSVQPNHFSADHARLASAFGDQVAIALENVRLFQAEQRRRETSAALVDIMHVASSSLELKQVLKHITQRTAQACRTERCSVFLLDDTGEYVQPVMSQFADGHAEPQLWELFQSSAADRVDAVPLFRDAIREGRPALLDNPARTDLLPRRWTEPYSIQKLLVVPLISRGRVIGLMALDHTDAQRTFTAEQVDLALTIGGRVAASIENAQLYARVERLAITDGLTDLYNRRYFYQELETELQRSKRYSRPCSLLMLDLDDFKHYNDHYGHLAGDDLLQELADLMNSTIRQEDTAARYGGEEFVVILPETGNAQALAVAERLWRVIRDHRFVVRGAQQAHTDADPITGPRDQRRSIGRITVSIGVATYPKDGKNVEELIDAADRALLCAKEEKDRVCAVWETGH